MIGANSSPMNMFTGDGGQAFQRGMTIGNANSPFASIADALKSTVDRYHAELDRQSEQQNKVDLLKQQYGLAGGNLLEGINAKYTQSAPHLSPSEQSIDPMHPEDPKYLRNVGGVTMYPQAIYDSYGRVKGYKYVNPRALSMMDIVGGGEGASTAGSADAGVNDALKEIQDLQSQLPQGI